MKILKNKNIPVALNVVGGGRNIPNREMPRIYNQNEILVNLTDKGSFDKTILEAMACESLVVVSNKSLEGILPERFILYSQNPAELADKIKAVFDLSKPEKERFGRLFRDYVVKDHNLDNLVSKFRKYYE